MSASDPPASVPAALLAKRQDWLEKHGDEMFPIYIVTAVFLVIFIFGPVLVTLFKFKEAGIYRVGIMITAVSYYLFWISVYISQLNPLMGPRYQNNTLAWISRAWGRQLQSATT